MYHGSSHDKGIFVHMEVDLTATPQPQTHVINHNEVILGRHGISPANLMETSNLLSYAMDGVIFYWIESEVV